MTDQVYVTRRIPESGLDLLRDSCAVDVHEGDGPPTRDELLDGVAEADGLVCLLSDPIDAGLIEAAPRLRAIANYAVGYDNIDVDAATERGIPVTNTPDVLTDATADLAFALLLAACRRVVEADRFVREGRFEGWGPRLLLGRAVHGRTLGIVGCGRIGTAVARRGALGFDMDVLYHARSRKAWVEGSLGATWCPDLDPLLEKADVVSLHVPLTEATHHLIDGEALRRMKETAFLVNTARGPVVDEAALVEALEEGAIAGAGLDVFEEEPEVHPGLLDRDDVVLAPHVGSATVETRDEMARMVAENLLAGLAGERPPQVVNPEAV